MLLDVFEKFTKYSSRIKLNVHIYDKPVCHAHLSPIISLTLSAFWPVKIKESRLAREKL